MFNDKSEMDGPCSTIRCSYSKLKPKATWFHTQQGKWVCFTCAQEANRTMMQQRMKYAAMSYIEMPPPPCITAQDYVLKLLSA